MNSPPEDPHYTRTCYTFYSELSNSEGENLRPETSRLMLGNNIYSISQGDSHSEVSPIQAEDELSACPEPIQYDDQIHKHLPIVSPDNLSYRETTDNSTLRTSSDSLGHTLQSQPWLPLYLRRPTLITFATLFGIMAMTLEALFYVSRRYHGLIESRSSLSYLWTYGPTIALTIIRAFWSRVDYEAKVTAPWRARAKSQRFHIDTLLLDYIDMPPLTVPWQAFRQGDYMVTASATVSLLCTLLIVLSTGLFTISSVNLVDESIPIMLNNQFVDNLDRLRAPSDLLRYRVQGLTHANLSYPEGYSNEFVYQSFTPEVEGVTNLRAVVEAMTVEFDCRQGNISDIDISSLILMEDGYTYTDISNLNVSFEHGDCNLIIPSAIASTAADQIFTQFQQNNTISIGSNFTQYIVHLVSIEGSSPGHCSSTGLDHKRIAFVSAEMKYQLTNQVPTSFFNTSAMTVEFKVTDIQSSSIVCTPNYEIVSVDVVQIGKNITSVSRHIEDSPRKFSNIHAWDVVFDGPDDPFNCHTCLAFLPTSNIGTTDLVVGPNALAMLDACEDLCLDFSSLLNPATLESILVRYFRKYASFRFQALLQPARIKSTATASRVTDRLLVQTLACQLMVTIMVIALAFQIGLSMMPSGPLTCSIEPGSILATASLIGFFTASCFPRDIGATDGKTFSGNLRKQLDSVHFTTDISNKTQTNRRPKSPNGIKSQSPLVLRPAIRIAASMIIISCVAALSIMLQKSNRDQGLGDVQDETYLHYIWTLLPSALLSTLALYFSSVDSHTRLLAPYYALASVAPISSSLQLNLSRPLLPRVLYQQLRTRSLAALMASLVTLFSAFFTISVGSLYQPQNVPFSNAISLQTISTFRMNFTSIDFKGDVVFVDEAEHLPPFLFKPYPNASSDSKDNVGLLSSLILESNLSFTQLVYEDLVFPELSLDLYQEISSLHIHGNSTTSVRITVPALRPRLSCRLYNESDIAATFLYNHTIIDYEREYTSDGIAINITGESCKQGQYQYFFQFDDLVSNNTKIFMMDIEGEGLFAAAFDNRTLISSRCSYFLYIWGRYSSLGSKSISTSALGCNDTLDAVDVEITLIGPQLLLDPIQPPRPIESTARPVSTKIVIENETFVTGNLLSLILYQKLAALPPYSNETTFDPFFEQLVTSRYAIPISAIADTLQNETVRDAIIFQHNIIAAQYYSQIFRIRLDTPLNETNGSAIAIFPPISSAPPTGDTGIYEGIMTDSNNRRRLVQDPASTFVLIGLLVIALVLSLVGWALSPRKPVLPRSPTSVASVLALLAGGNILEYMYKDEDAHWERIEDAMAVFPDGCKFWMGWGPPGVAECEDKKRFGIWMIFADDLEEINGRVFLV